MSDATQVLDNEELLSPLRQHYESLKHSSLANLFDADPQRFQTFLVTCGDLHIDFSKHFINEKIREDLCALATAAGLSDAIEALFSGEKVNNTEKRAALHSALRAPSQEQPEELRDAIANAQKAMFEIAAKINQGEWLGFSGKPITDIVNIGIGGSDLGPAMAVQALQSYQTNKDLKFHFVSNIDPTDVSLTFAECDPETTLFIVASKTFTTLETLSNANTARKWLLAAYDNNVESVANHFLAISTNKEKVTEFGINEKNILTMWDWVGGRYSIWSTIGLPLCAAIGEEQFKAFLDGAYQLDQHLKTTDLENNAPVQLALLSIWYSEFFGAQSHGVLCYEHFLDKFPDYLQQLDMESNGKSVTKSGKPVASYTGIPVWGNVGSNSQHSFHQLLHQGRTLVPVDFIVGVNSCNPQGNQHQDLFSNCLAQSQALMLGRNDDQIREELAAQGLSQEEQERLIPHKRIEGNKPSTTILYPKLT
ncbi:MAG: glucose-6-phosphate isomerase, partial [Pseudomonadales bacterium]|nr:glucose-6-phosphate isomerase [Pseudomonadales bacterium]